MQESNKFGNKSLDPTIVKKQKDPTTKLKEEAVPKPGAVKESTT